MNNLKITPAIFAISSLLLSICAPLSTMAQVDTLWTKVLYEPSEQSVMSSLPTRDGGLLILGQTGDIQNGSASLYLLKIDSLGGTKSRRIIDSETLYSLYEDTFGGRLAGISFYKLQTSADGMLLILGNAILEDWNGDDYDRILEGVILRIDIDGSIVSLMELPVGIQSVSEILPADRGYYFVGENNDRIVMMKTDLRFREVWTRAYGDSGWACTGAVLQDSTIIIGGYRRTFIHNNSQYDPVLIRVSSAGAESFARCYDDSLSRHPDAIASGRNGSIVLVGSANSYNNAGSLVGAKGYIGKFSREGEIVFERSYPGLERASFVNAIQVTGGEIGVIGVTGRTNNHGTIIEHDAYFLLIDAEGEASPRSFILGGEQNDLLTGVVPTRDGGCVLIGTTESFNARQTDVWLIKTFPDPNHTPPEIRPVTPTLALTGYPNPFNSRIEITVNAPRSMIASISICDATGRSIQTLVNSRVLTPGVNRFGWMAGDLPAGQYFIELASERGDQLIGVCLVK